MSNRFTKSLVVLACAGLALGYGVGVSGAKPSVTDGDPVAALAVPPLCSFSVFASNLTNPGPMIFRGTDLYVAEWNSSTDMVPIVKITAAGVSSVLATIDASGSAPAGAGFPTDLAFDASGDLSVAVGSNAPDMYWKVAPTGQVSSWAIGTGRGPSSIEIDGAGNVYTTDGYADTILKNGSPFAAWSGDLASANGLLWEAPALYALESGSIQQVNATGAFALVANIGTANSRAFTLQPGTGVFYFFDPDSSPDVVAKVRPSGSPTNVCSLGYENGLASDLEFGPDGALFVSNFYNGTVLKISVPTPSQEVQSLVDDVNGLSAPSGTKNSLTAKLDAALQSLAAGATDAARGQLKAFINEVKARCCVPQPGKTLTQDEADALIAAAESLLASLP